jgi:hypothetical protein
LIAALIAGVAYVPARIIAEAGARDRAYHGTVTTVGFCRYPGRDKASAVCEGDFRSDDGTLVVRGVEYSVGGYRSDSGEPLPARLSGPDDRTAEVDGEVWVGQAVMWTLDAVLLAWLVAQSIWFVRATRHWRAT